MGNRKEVDTFETTLRIQPHSVEAEKAVLGAMIIDKDALDKVVEQNIEPSDFFVDLHKRIFDIIRGMYIQQKPVDILTLTDAIKAGKIVSSDAQTAAAYVISIVNTVPTSANVDHYTHIVREKSMLRKIIRVGTGLIENAYGAERDVDNILDSAEQEVLDIRAKRPTEFVHVKELVSGALDRLEQAAKSQKEVTGLATGFVDFDIMTCGLQPANLIIVAGRPSMGKTAFAMNIAEHVVVDLKKAVAVFSLEMSKEELMLRFLCSRGRINSLKAKKGFIGKDGWPRLTTQGEIFSESPLYIDDSASGDMLEMKSRARKLHKELLRSGSGLSLIIIDYMQLMHSVGRAESRQQEISLISRSLKRLSMELHIPVIAVSQLSRKPEEKGRSGRPQLSDLRESGAIEQDADLVVSIYREFYYKEDKNNATEDEKNKAEIEILKQRNGPTGRIDLVFLNDYTRFDNLDRAHAKL